MDKKLMTNFVGRAGEFRILSELLLRGENPALRSIDYGIDIVLENGKTIQVKTVTKSNVNKGKGYNISLTNVSYKKGKRIKRNNGIKADFLVIWLIDINIFYIIPTKILSKITCLNVEPNRKSKYEIYKNLWKILNEEVK